MFERTQKEIDYQIAGLQKSKEGMPRTSFFGDDNWASIEAQIKVLQGKDAEDYADDGDYRYSAALDAAEWLAGEKTDDLFEIE